MNSCWTHGPVRTAITAEDEKALARRVRAGDRSARDQMIERNIPLVSFIASRVFPGCGMPLKDRIQDGTIGLIRAVDGFDPERGTRFTTYASAWIKQTIGRSIMKNHFIRIPVWALTRVRYQSSPRFRETPGLIDQATRMYRLGREELRTDHAVCYSDDSEESLDDTSHIVQCALNKIHPMDAEAIRLRYGIGGGEPMLVREVAKAQGMSEDTARASIRRGIEEMRPYLEELQL